MDLNSQGKVEFTEAGFNYRMCELQAALGVEQMLSFQRIGKVRKTQVNFYLKELANTKGINLISRPQDGINNYQSFVILLDKNLDRATLMEKLAQRNIETTIGTYALHTQPVYARFGYKTGDIPNSLIAYENSLALPLYNSLSRNDQKYIIDNLKELIDIEKS
jgi:dTDP-4-amino-4,6-dideoxygalactose transaminase